MAALRATGLTKRFGALLALDGVDLCLEEGEVRGLLGPNGAGKTTLLRVLLGLLRADGGAAELLGHPLRALSGPGAAAVAGFVEEPSFYPYLSARANLEVLAELDGRDGDSAARIERALARVGLAERAAGRVGGYSTGMRQRLGIAAALIRAPRLLLLDEPTSGLDPAGVALVNGLIGELAGEGVAVLLSSHQIGEVETVCHGFDVLSCGRVVWSGTAAEMRAQAPASAHLLLTSDDERAFALAAEHTDVQAQRAPGGGLVVQADQQALDGLVLALAQAGVAVRSLRLQASPLESMFFALTGGERTDAARGGQR